MAVHCTPCMGQPEQGADHLHPSTTKDPPCPGPIPSGIPHLALGGLIAATTACLAINACFKMGIKHIFKYIPKKIVPFLGNRA